MSVSGFDRVKGNLAFMSQIKPEDRIELEGEPKRSAEVSGGLVSSIVSALFSWKDWYSGSTQKQAALLTNFVKKGMDDLDIVLQSPAESDLVKTNFYFIENALENIQKGLLRHHLIQWSDPETKRVFASTSNHIHEILHQLRSSSPQSSATLISPQSIPTKKDGSPALKLDIQIPVSIDGKLFNIVTNKDIQNRFSALNVVLDSFGHESERELSNLDVAHNPSGNASITLEQFKKFMNLADFDKAYDDMRLEYPTLPHQSKTMTFENDHELNLFVCRFFINELKKEMIFIRPELTADEIALVVANILPWLSFNAIAFEIFSFATDEGTAKGNYFTRLPGQEQGESMVSILDQKNMIRIRQNQQMEWVDLNTGKVADSPLYSAEAVIPLDGSEASLTIRRISSES